MQRRLRRELQQLQERSRWQRLRLTGPVVFIGLGLLSRPGFFFRFTQIKFPNHRSKTVMPPENVNVVVHHSHSSVCPLRKALASSVDLLGLLTMALVGCPWTCISSLTSSILCLPVESSSLWRFPRGRNGLGPVQVDKSAGASAQWVSS